MAGVKQQKKTDRSSVDGYITVFLAMITGVLLTLFLVLLEGARIHTIRFQTECVTDMAMDSCLAEYHREMFEQYDLFWIDTSYGTGNPSLHRTEDHLLKYMNMNFQPADFWGIEAGRDLTGLQADTAAILQASVASDDGGDVLKYQAVQYEKQMIGLEMADTLLNNLAKVQGSGYTDFNMESQWEEAERAMTEEIRRGKELKEEEWDGEVGELPSDEAASSRGAGILELAGSGRAFSRKQIPVSALASHRKLNRGTGLKEGLKPADSLADKVLFCQYIREHCAFLGKEKEESDIAYQLEYILHGEGNDRDNLRKTMEEIMLIREAVNAAYLFADEEKKGQAETAALVASVLLGVPEAESVITSVILFGWAFAESVQDVRILMDGGRVPLVKDADSWNISFLHLLFFRSHLGNYKDEKRGMKYEDYLMVFLMMQREEQTTVRLMDIMEYDIRRTAGNEGFRIDGCIDSMETEISVSSGYGYQYSINRTYGYMQ